MHRRSKSVLAAAALVSVLAVAGCAPQGGAPVNTGSAEDQGDKTAVDALVAAAKKEGTVTWYTEQPPAIDNAAASAFKAAYGIDVQFVAFNNVQLTQRYATEASSGAIAADVISMANSTGFYKDAITKGWIMPLSKADLPAAKLGTFPQKFLQEDVSFTMGTNPFKILYSKDKISGDMVPKTLDDLTDPKYKGKVLLADPSGSDTFVGFYTVIQQKYGNEWFAKMRANEAKLYPTVSGAGQAMVAGEGDLVTPAAEAVAKALQESGAPVATVTPPVTTGGLINTALTDSSKAPHPNAGKLFANWLMSKSGNLAALGGVGASPWATDQLPSGFVELPAVTPEKKAEILKLLGVG